MTTANDGALPGRTTSLRALGIWILLSGLSGLLFFGCGSKPEEAQSGASATAKVTIRIDVDPSPKGLELTQKIAEEFEQKNGVHVELIKGPTDVTERLSQYQQYFGAKSADIDVYQVDVIWPGQLAEHLLDLTQDFSTDTSAFFKSIIENDTVNGKLVAIPWFGDAGMLYYRTDLLKKYGFTGPPKTWDELEQMAAKIQEGERAAGNHDFWGYVWQGKANEGLTCNALEWQVSQGGGTILETGPKVTVNNPNSALALKRAAGWIGRISPPGVTTYQEEEARQNFQQGNAAFMRNWPYAYALGNGKDSAVRGKFDVSVLPAGSAGNAAALGGWQLAVSRYSKHPHESVEFIRSLVSKEAEKRRAIEVSNLPSRTELYDDADITSAIPFLKPMKSVFLNATPRPSTIAGDRYNEVSTAYFQAVHQVLTKESSAEQALAELDKSLQQILK